MARIEKPSSKKTFAAVVTNACFELRFQRVAATQAPNFSAGVWYCKVFLGRSFSRLAAVQRTSRFQANVDVGFERSGLIGSHLRRKYGIGSFFNVRCSAEVIRYPRS
jgi:hypothetical protein